jgi:hypothetical protein
MRTRAIGFREMLCRVLVGAAMLAPIRASAQHTTPAPGRVAGIAPAPATQPPTTSHFVPPATVFYGHIPVLVLTDGRVFANFGRGYEQVVRSCGLPVSYGGQVMSPSSPTQPGVVQPTVTQPTIGTPTPTLPYTRPVPSQPTQSQQMQSQITQPVQSNQQWNNSQWCWAVGPTGRVFVGYP